MTTTQIDRLFPASEVARLMLRLHTLGLEGKGNAPEAAEACAAMEEPWDQMTEQEQERMRGLSEDLYVIEDGGAKQVTMSPAERESWGRDFQAAFKAYQDGDPDPVLAFLRQPSPADVPRYAVPFLQARCWEKLGELDVAVVFMKESERHNPEEAAGVLHLLQKAGRSAEAEQYARRTYPTIQTQQEALTAQRDNRLAEMLVGAGH
jgi:hypothetical protein